MNLTINDICRILSVPEKTVYRWIQRNEIPYYRINQQYRFNQAEINDWILRNNMDVSQNILDYKITEVPVSLSELVNRGGFYDGIAGDSMPEILENVIQLISLPREIDKRELLDLLLEREELIPTSVGKGIAFPHPRSPIMSDVHEEAIVVIQLAQDLDYPSEDLVPLHTLFILFSANSKRHLEILSKLSLLCQEEDFVQILQSRGNAQELMGFIKEKELEWEQAVRGESD